VADQHLGTSLCSAGAMTPGSLLRGAVVTGGYNAANNGVVRLYSAEEAGTAAPVNRLSHLRAPSPNPFNPRTQIVLQAATPTTWQVRIFDARGRHVGTVFEGWLQAGEHPLVVDAAGLSSGVYWFEARGSNGERLVTRGALVR
jgi:hypothetical protein